MYMIYIINKTISSDINIAYATHDKHHKEISSVENILSLIIN